MTASQDQPVALVTGGAQGIGLGIVEMLLTHGWAVMLGDVDANALAASERRLAADGSVAGQTLDVGDPQQVETVMNAIDARFGRLDGLVNNAGIMATVPPSELDLATWDRVLRTNLTGAFLCAQAAEPRLRVGGGAIVNIASTRALMSEPDTEAYAASKGGLVALTHALAMSLGPAIRVNAVSPGWIDVTGWASPAGRPPADPPDASDHAQHPAGRVGRPADVASLVAWLLSADARFVTASNFVVDGGMTHKMIYL